MATQGVGVASASVSAPQCITEFLLANVTDSLPHTIEQFGKQSTNAAFEVDPALESAVHLLEYSSMAAPTVAISEVSETMRDHLKERVQYLSRMDAKNLMRDILLAGPVAPASYPILAEIVARTDFHAKDDAAQVWAPFAEPSALRYLPPAAVFTFHAKARQRIWKAAPGRFHGDMMYLLHQSISQLTMQLPYDAKEVNKAAPNRKFRARKKVAPFVKEIIASLSMEHGLYHSTCEMIKSQYHKTQDVRWALLRSEMCIVWTMARDSTASTAASHIDPLHKVIMAADAFTWGNQTAAELLTTIRATIESLRNQPAAGARSGGSTLKLSDVREQIKAAVDATIEFAQARPNGVAFCKAVRDMYDKTFVANYSKVVKSPMDFGTMKKKVNTYRSWDEALADAELIVKNSEAFNGPAATNIYSREAATLAQFFRDTLSRARVNVEGAASLSTAPVFDIADVLLVCNDPFVVRKAAQHVIEAIPASCANATRVFESTPTTLLPADADSALCSLFLLILADMANSRHKTPTSTTATAAATAPTVQARVAASRGRSRGRGRIVSAASSAGKLSVTPEQLLDLLGPVDSTPSKPLPVLISSMPPHVELLCRTLQNIFMEFKLGDAPTSTEFWKPPPSESSSADAPVFATFDVLVKESEAMCTADKSWKVLSEVLRRGKHPFTLTLTYLIVAFLAHHGNAAGVHKLWRMAVCSVAVCCTADGDFSNAFLQGLATLLPRELTKVPSGPDSVALSYADMCAMWLGTFAAPFLEVAPRLTDTRIITQELLVSWIVGMAQHISPALLSGILTRALWSLSADNAEEGAVSPDIIAACNAVGGTAASAYLMTLAKAGLVSVTALRLLSGELDSARSGYAHCFGLLAEVTPDETTNAEVEELDVNVDVLRHYVAPKLDMLTGVSASPLPTPGGTPFLNPASPFTAMPFRKDTGLLTRTPLQFPTPMSSGE